MDAENSSNRARPRGWFSAELATAVAVLLLALTGWLAGNDLGEEQVGHRLDDRIHAAELAGSTFIRSLIDVETGERGYLLTGDNAFLEPFETSRGRVAAELDDLGAQLAPIPEAAPRLQRLRELAAAKLEWTERNIALRRAGAGPEAVARVATGTGKRLMDANRAELAAIHAAAETRLMDQRRRQHEASILNWVAVITLSSFASVLLGLAAFDQRRIRRAVAADLARLQTFTRAFGLAQGFLRERSGVITHWTEGAERLYGYRREEALGQLCQDLLRTSYPRPRAEIEAELTREGRWQGELARVRRDGVPLTVVSNWALHQGNGPGGEAVIEMSNDITALKRAEEAAERASTLLRAVLETTPCPVYAKDRAGRILLANSQYLATIGRDWSTVAGRSSEDFQHDLAEAALAMESDQRVMAEGRSDSVEELVTVEGGGTRVLLVNKTPMRGADGTVTGLVGVAFDITERRAAETALSRLNTELELRVADALAAREDAQRRAAQAERLQALGQLAGGIAHDFNNVLQAIAGALSLIEMRSTDSDRVRRLAQTAATAAERGGAITRRLLAFARRGDLRAEAIDVVRLLADMREVLAHALGSRVNIEVSVAPGLPSVFADKGQLETVLVNLATNARDAMPDGGTLRFRCVEENVEEGRTAPSGLAPGRYVCLSATDTGSGMDAATLGRVTEPFFSTKPPGQGTGLGLSMARGFAEQSGGAMRVDSAPGRGTTVSLWLPATTRLPAAAATPAAAPAATAGPTQGLLLVDDDALVRQTLAEQLEHDGYAVTVAANAGSALERLAADPAIALLVTDFSMPGEDGMALIRAARDLRPGLPAILLTGYAGGEPGNEHAKVAAGDGVIVMRKPVRGFDLAGQIAALLANDPDAAWSG